MAARRSTKADAGPVFVAAASILANILQGVRNQNLENETAGMRTQVDHLLAVLREWQAAHSQLTIRAEGQEKEILRLRAEVARLRKKLAAAEAAAAASSKA